MCAVPSGKIQTYNKSPLQSGFTYKEMVYTMINHDYMVDRDGDHWIRYY